MSDFPRGWTLSNFSNGGVATITVAAIAGVTHVLDVFSAVLANYTAAQTGATVTLTSSDGVFTGFVIGRVDAPANSVGSDGASSLGLAAGPGASMTIAFGGGAANVLETLRIQGHDI